jgi:poly(3-hydroxybutyrate) depolymerase
MRFCVMLLLVAMAYVGSCGSAIAGEGEFSYQTTGRKVQVWTYVPAKAPVDAPVVFVMHGVKRNAVEYRESWVPLADRYGCIVLAPEFSERDWPGTRSYHHGNVLDRNGKPLPEDEWAFSVLDGIFQKFCNEQGNDSEKYYLFGHSAGAQFVHRMLLLKPHAMCAAAVAANAGVYSMPDFERTWPHGLKGAPVTREQVQNALAQKLCVLLGEDDVDQDDNYLPKDADSMEQGEHRVARGQKFFATARDVAEKEQAKFGWKLRTVPGVGHDNKGMAAAAAEVLFADR